MHLFCVLAALHPGWDTRSHVPCPDLLVRPTSGHETARNRITCRVRASAVTSSTGFGATAVSSNFGFKAGTSLGLVGGTLSFA